MAQNHTTQTIAAISTPLAVGSIGIVRLSGESAIEIASRIFTPIGERTLENVTGFSAIYGKIKDSEGLIDEAVVTLYRAPKSYTGEDVVEISTHGGLLIVRRVLRACLDAGAIAAQGGEFTKRAFLNGKLDLTQAEAVIDLIGARSNQALQAALAAREGRTFREMTALKNTLLNISAHLGAWADYPEEEIPEVEEAVLTQQLQEGCKKLEKLLCDYDRGEICKNGVDTVIVGKPNVGKSTLMNLLAGRQKSIVTSIEGTTRDVVEDTILLGDVVLNLADTAGLRESADPIEQVGVLLAKEKLSMGYLILAVFDQSRALSTEDVAIMELIQGRPVIAVINKTDLPAQLDRQAINQKFACVVELCAAENQGVEELAAAVHQVLGINEADLSAGILGNERQRAAVAHAKEALTEAVMALSCSFTLDAVNVCIDEALSFLLELTGERATNAIIDEVFSNFCVGK